MPLAGALIDRVLQVQLGLLERRSRLLDARLGGGRPRARGGDLLRPGLRRAQARLRLLFAGARLHQPALRDADAGFGFGHLRLRGVGRRASALRRPRPSCRTAAARFRPSPAGRAAVRRRGRPWRRWPPLPARRACAVVSRARAASSSFCAWSTRPARLFHRPLRRADVARRRGRRNRHAALRGGRRRLGVGQLGARLVDRHLVVARIELDEHGAGFDRLVVVDVHPQHGARRRATRSASPARRPAHRRSIRVRRSARTRRRRRRPGRRPRCRRRLRHGASR